MRYLILALTLTACATTSQRLLWPTMDPSMNPEGRSVQEDIAECNALAKNNTGASALEGGVAGGAFGALTGALIAAALGADMGRSASVGAVSGGMTVAVGNASYAANARYEIVMSGRGYAVLN